MLVRTAHLVSAHRKTVIAVWLALTAVGAYAAQAASGRWLGRLSVPGSAAYQTNQRTLKTFGSGAQYPLVAVFQGRGAVTNVGGLERAIAAAAAVNPGSRTSSFFSTGNRAYVSGDGHTTFAEIYPPGNQGFDATVHADRVRAALEAKAPPGVHAYLTGHDALYDAQGEASGPSVLTEAIIGGAGALVILLFVFGTLPAVAIPLAVAVAAILNTFTLAWALIYLTDVSFVVQFLIALVGLGIAIDYSLLMIFRFREELARGRDVDDALVETVRHGGRAVIVSGSTVAIGLLSMVILPIPIFRSIGLAGLLIPTVAMLATLTLVPALLALCGRRINHVPLLPRRFIDITGGESPLWRRWAGAVTRRPLAAAIAGLAIVAILVGYGLKLNPNEAQLNDLPGGGDAVAGRAALNAAGFSAGVMKPLVVLVEGDTTHATTARVVRRLKRTPGIDGAAAPRHWRHDRAALVEAFPAWDGASARTHHLIGDLDEALPRLASQLPGTRLSLGGVAPEERDFADAIYGKFAYVLAFVAALSFLLLMRAFRSVLLALKAVALNLTSLGAAFGILVLVFQQGHGSHLLWGLDATGAIVTWIPLMIFAFLYGLSMDYEVFMLARIRESYDESGDTTAAVANGLAATGKLVTSAALVLMFAFFVLSTGPVIDLKQFGVGLAAGIAFDATVIRALLVPALARLFGRWNWWFPPRLARALRVASARG